MIDELSDIVGNEIERTKRIIEEKINGSLPEYVGIYQRSRESYKKFKEYQRIGRAESSKKAQTSKYQACTGIYCEG